MIGRVLAVAERALGALRKWEDQRAADKWLRVISHTFPVGAMVRCLCERCAETPRVWYVRGYDVGARELRVVSNRDALSKPWPPSSSVAECNWLSSDPRLTVRAGELFQ